jgi:transcriptional regulator with AAA-type ATPase domain
MAASDEVVTEATVVGPSKSDSSRADLHLLVMGEGVFMKHPLRRGDSLVIGRSTEAHIKLEDKRASRQHARLTVGERFQIEDLGSANGTRIRDVQLVGGQLYEIGPGEPITIGTTILMVQQAFSQSRPKRLWQHGYFEARLEEELARSERTGSKLSLLRVQLTGIGDQAAASLIAGHLRAGDVLASYGPSDLEVLLVDSDAIGARRIMTRINKTLREHEVTGRIGLAVYPEDGRTPESLISHACGLVLGGSGGEATIVVRSPAMRRLYELAERMAKGTISVLILGETGVGKEVLAEWLHRASPRAGKSFVKLNCAAFTETLIESELFGHEKGAFTGAAAAKAGLIESADGGTVFLDEVGELPPVVQAKLLRVLETHEVMRVGSLKPRQVDVRFVAATNRDLESDITHKKFRQDLYFRLNGATLVIPPLRERVEELPDLCQTFVARAAEQLARTPPALSASALTVLERYWWPGNVRELRNVLERAVLLCSDDEILPLHLPVEKMEGVIAEAKAPPSGQGTRDSREPGDERQAILDALAACAGNQSRAAKLLGISRRTLVSRLSEFGLPRPRK